MKSFTQYKLLINTTQTLAESDIKRLFIIINKDHKDTGIKDWMQSEFKECNLLLKDVYNHLNKLRLSYEGIGGKIRTRSPLDSDDWYQVRHGSSVLLIGTHNTLEANDMSISIPLYQIVYNKDVRGFKYYISGGKPVIIKT